jgi:hypothetical protein
MTPLTWGCPIINSESTSCARVKHVSRETADSEDQKRIPSSWLDAAAVKGSAERVLTPAITFLCPGLLKLDVARKKAVSYLGQVTEGIDPQAPKDALKAARTVKSLAEAYIGRHAKLKKNTWVEDESYLTRHLLPDSTRDWR